MKTIMTITGIRPDFIRMSEVFRELDKRTNHILVHTGQHYDKMLSDVFFSELDLRTPDYNLSIGQSGRRHHEQLSVLSVKIIELIEQNNIKPDMILFLGDSNSVLSAVPLKKEGYTIGHIEAGMRSYDRRMLEEINRVVCDHCSDYLFVYHEDYAEQLYKEGIKNNVHVVGNTIVEVCQKYKPSGDKRRDKILLDIHRPENFKHPERLSNIIKYANQCGERYNLPVEMLSFNSTINNIEKFNVKLGAIKPVSLMPYIRFLGEQYHASFMISDSGTAQEEPALLGTKVIVPRDYTERSQSVSCNCSYMINVNSENDTWGDSCRFIDSNCEVDSSWLGKGNTAKEIVDCIMRDV